MPELAELRRDAAKCTACELYADATQTVFGSGPTSASVVLIGEQPGDREDIGGEPFVGPAGRVLDRALERARVARKLHAELSSISPQLLVTLGADLELAGRAASQRLPAHQERGGAMPGR